MWKRPKYRRTPSPIHSNAVIRIFAAFLIFALIAAPLSAVSAADETVNGLSLDTNAQLIELGVEDNAVSLRALASVAGGGQKDVTDDAAWTSSSSLIKVSKGVITATGSISYATITAKYKGFSATVQVSADYLFDSLKLKTLSPTGDVGETMDVELGSELKLGAVPVKNGSEQETVTSAAAWTSSNTGAATVSGGVVTLVGEGKTTITVKHKGRSDSVVLNVESPYTGIKINSSPPIDSIVEMYLGETPAITLTATATLKPGSSKPTQITEEATWSSSNVSVVKVDKGVVTAVGAGTAVVTVKRFGVSDTVTFHVRTLFEGMKLLPEKPIAFTLYGAAVEVSAEVSKGTAAPIEITSFADAEWKVADPFVAAIKKVGAKVYVEPKSVGSTKVSISYKGLTKEQTVTVYPTIISVDITKSTLDVFLEENGAMPAVTGTTVSGATQDIAKLVKWTSSNPNILTLEDGKWKALKQGTVTLTAEVENEPGVAGAIKSDTIEVEVHKKLLELVPETTSIILVTGRETALPKVQLIYEDGEEADISDKITWKSSNTKLLVAPPKMKGLLPTSVNLTGTYLGKSVTIKVQVEEEFTSFQIVPKTIDVTLNKSQTIKVTGITKSGKKVSIGSRIDWEATNPELVTIKGASVKGLAEGGGKLTGKVQGKTLEIPYTVTAKLTKLTVSEKTLKTSIGAAANILLVAEYENGKVLNVTSQAAWTTSNAKVATVAGGTIKVNGKGSATIKASFGGKTATVRVSAK